MSRPLRIVGRLSALAGLAVLALSASYETAEAKRCRVTTCVKRAPFVCKGPIGSCGFAQGKCLRYVTRMTWCSGSGPVVR